MESAEISILHLWKETCVRVIISASELEFWLCSCFSQPAFVWYPLEPWLITLAQIQDRKGTDKIKE